MSLTFNLCHFCSFCTSLVPQPQIKYVTFSSWKRRWRQDEGDRSFTSSPRTFREMSDPSRRQCLLVLRLSHLSPEKIHPPSLSEHSCTLLCYFEHRFMNLPQKTGGGGGGGEEGMTKGKSLPCESESPGFLMVPSNCSLIRGPLMSCFSTHQLA